MSPPTLQLKPLELDEIRLSVEEPCVIRRANILNCLHLGYPSGDIAKILNVDPKTVTNVGNAYLEGGLDSALYDEERSGRPIDFDDRERSRIVAMVCSAAERLLPLDTGFDRGGGAETRSGERRARRDQPRDGRVILKEHDLKPWQEKMWCIGKLDEDTFAGWRMCWRSTPGPTVKGARWSALIEKPVPLIFDTTARLLPRDPGEVMLKDYEYERGGSANVFCGVEPKAGIYINKVTKSRDGLELSIFMTELAHLYESAEKVTLVMDISTHSRDVLQEHLGEDLARKLWGPI